MTESLEQGYVLFGSALGEPNNLPIIHSLPGWPGPLKFGEAGATPIGARLIGFWDPLSIEWPGHDTGVWAARRHTHTHTNIMTYIKHITESLEQGYVLFGSALPARSNTAF